MPSDKIAAVCVMHLMKLLFTQFVKDHKFYDEQLTSNNMSDVKEMEFLAQEMKIPAVQLFLDLGKHFDAELKATLSP